MVHLFAFPSAELPSREKHLFPDLPDLDPSPYAPEITNEEYEYFQKVVDQGKEKRRRAKVLKEQGGGEPIAAVENRGGNYDVPFFLIHISDYRW